MYRIETPTSGILAIVPRPRGGDWLAPEIVNLKAGGIDVLVSLLEPAEAIELGLVFEEWRCVEAGIEFVSLPVPDRSVPNRETEFLAAAEGLRARIAAGGHVRLLRAVAVRRG